ncbi:hypothetical protein ATANTOWER_023032 [Ataeniobius toweri]|uniref:Uncharacterized protein n=1 Tax=Ataeniobius toweri TaxID=208326 RepID=A0ABU7A7Q9_9TELE|nr:hypothetical protein [Ataeniobius toweri]
MPLPAPCLTSLALDLDPVSVHGFTPQPSPWFIQPELVRLSSLLGFIVKRTITALCVPATASADSPEVLDHIFFWVPLLFPRLRRLVVLLNSVLVLSFIQPLTRLSVLSDLWKLTPGLLFSDSCFAE